ncbi:single-stranded DNA-binding protein [Belliella kenyensis]|uniref:Single-stranded DNA-binding protein n=1 Tax=Belliella kenyensis TaxID=1472724 RepID=A0ABV8EMQ1_9BACT|nr:single-stranded DNA-binding protein [Belliella kenyensis]MCH7403508.1 single-stranded DNA-binding protein [Belliella kenyensis]MDN3604970.1 single-stranded DNA-binding protein [Belliella kenyensis]
MSGIRNRVQLIGRLAAKPELTQFESGKKKASFRMATNEYYKNANGEKVEETTWHNVVAWDKAASILEKYTDKGSEIGIVGKLTNRSYDDKDGNKRYVTEVLADEILLLGEKAT